MVSHEEPAPTEPIPSFYMLLLQMRRVVCLLLPKLWRGIKLSRNSLTAAQTLLVGSTGTANSTLQVQGSVSLSIRTITATTTLTNNDYTVLVNASGGAVNVTLPTPTTTISGRTYIIKKIAGGLTNDVVVNGAIEDGNSFSLYNDWTVLKVQTDGNRWYVIK